MTIYSNYDTKFLRQTPIFFRPRWEIFSLQPEKRQFLPGNYGSLLLPSPRGGTTLGQRSLVVEAHWKITILVNNYAREKDFKAEHGLSLLIEDEKSGALVLLDAGQSGDVLLHNARVLGIDWSRLTAVVLSHGHFDHTGGLAAVFESLDKPVPLLHHPDAFLPKAAGSPALHSIGTKPLVSAKALAFPSRNDTPLSDNLWITGEIPPDRGS